MLIMNKIKYVIHEMYIWGAKIPRIQIITYLDMAFCMVYLGASPSNYYHFDFCNASFKERKSFLTHRLNERLMSKYNRRSDIWRLEDKYEFEKTFECFCKRKCAKNTQLSYNQFVEEFGGKKIIYKPLNGGQGRDILIWQVNKSNESVVYDEIKKLSEGIIEEWILQDERMSFLYSKSVNPIRIQTLRDDNKVHIITATLTIGNGTDIANASAVRAIFALVDVKTGVVYTDGCDYDGNYYLEHPISHAKIKEFQIPFWDEVLNLVESAAMQLQNLGYVGWDVAITKDGPIIVEGNNDAGYLAYQLPLLTKTHKGIKEKYEMYL